MFQKPAAPSRLQISTDPYMHLNPDVCDLFNEMLASGPDQSTHQSPVEEHQDSVHQSCNNEDFVSDMLTDVEPRVAKTSQLPKCSFYTKYGAYLNTELMSIPSLRSQVEFVVTPSGSVISKTRMDMGVLVSRDGSGYELVSVMSFCIDDNGIVFLRYKLFHDDSVLSSLSYDKLVRTDDIDRYLCDAYVCMGLPNASEFLDTYTSACKKLHDDSFHFGFGRIGIWSKRNKVPEASRGEDVVDVADCLQFYHARPEHMWLTRLGKHVCNTFIQPILDIYDGSPRALSILGFARNASQFHIQPRATSANICMMCDTYGKCTQTTVIDGNLHIDTDMHCSIAIELMHLITKTVVRFRIAALPNPYEYEKIKTMFKLSRMLLRTLLQEQTK